MKQFSSVDEYIGDLSPTELEKVQMLRQIILQNVSVNEHIKWNSPSYIFEEEDRITFNVKGDTVKIVLHMGAKRKEDKTAKPILNDTSGIILWNSDIRGTITFESKEDILIKRLDFIHLIKNWLQIK